MIELLGIMTRYFLVAYGYRLVEQGFINEQMIEPLVGGVMVVGTLGWMLQKRFWPKIKKFWKESV